MSKILNEFKEFAVKGNAVDMAVGVIIGGAFGKIVSSIVDDIIMPPVGWLIGGCQLQRLEIHIACGGDSRCGEHDGCHHQLR